MPSIVRPVAGIFFPSALLCFAMFVGGCDRPELGSGDLKTFRCEEDGLCWKRVGKRSMEGGYRAGERELRFDLIFSPSRSIETGFKDEWSYRIADWLGQEFVTAASSNPPANWRPPEVPSGLAFSPEHVQARVDLAKRMAEAVHQEDMQIRNLVQPWSEFKWYLRNFLKGPHFLPGIDDVGVADSSPTTGSLSAYVRDIHDSTIPQE